MKLAIIVQRYGADVSGGAELHARYIAERLARHATVEVLTTCARDYLTWKNELPAGEQKVNGVAVRRFAVARPRDANDFGRRSQHVFEQPHSLADELKWLESEGPTSPALIKHLAAVRSTFDFFVFFSYRYYLAWHGVRTVAEKAVLVPTAERDPAIGLAMFAPIFRGARAIMFNSFEERALIQHVSGRQGPGVVVGVGSEIPARTQPWRFKKKFNIKRPFAIYVGRIDENKGCKELFEYFERYAVMYPHGLDLVLVGAGHIPVPKHPRIRHLGFLSDEDKFDGLAAADVLIMPSRFESLSMVALEAWALGKPVLANGRCDVLRGQVHPQQRRPVLRELRGVRRGAVRAGSDRAARRAARPERPRVLPPALHLAGDRAEVPRHVRAVEARPGSAGRSTRCPGSSRAAVARSRRPDRSSSQAPAGPVVQ